MRFTYLFPSLLGKQPPADDDRLLVEQLRLLLGGVGNTVLPVLAIAVFLYLYLSNDSNQQLLLLWTAAVILSNLNWFRYAKRWRDVDFSLPQARRIVWNLMAINIVGSALWGVLPWITMLMAIKFHTIRRACGRLKSTSRQRLA